MITAAQIRAARAMIGWSAAQLAESARLARTTIVRAEASDRTPSPITRSNLYAIKMALESAGVVFTDEGFVGLARLDPPETE